MAVMARLAGIPDAVLQRAGQILKERETSDMAIHPAAQDVDMVDNQEINVDNPVDKYILSDLKALNLENMTPMMALQKLYSYLDAFKEN